MPPNFPHAEWTDGKWYSEENSDGFTCPKDKVLSGIECKGKRCDSLKFFCKKPDNFEIGGSSEESLWFNSDDDGLGKCQYVTFCIFGIFHSTALRGRLHIAQKKHRWILQV